MKLGSSFPATDLPKCYHADEYNPEATRSQNRAHIVVEPGQFTFWSDEGERTSHWTSWSTTTLDEFVKRFHHSKIYGDFATYPLIVTQIRYGLHIDFALKGRLAEFEEKRIRVRDMIAGLLARHLKSFSHRAIGLLLAFVK